MTFRTLAAIAALVLTSTAAVAEECTPESIQAQQGELIAAIEDLAARDPERAQQLVLDFQAKVNEAAASEDEEAVCKAFDELMAVATG